MWLLGSVCCACCLSCSVLCWYLLPLWAGTGLPGSAGLSGARGLLLEDGVRGESPLWGVGDGSQP